MVLSDKKRKIIVASMLLTALVLRLLFYGNTDCPLPCTVMTRDI
jgi:hypothetical protein